MGNVVKTTRSVLRSVDDLRTFVTEYDYDSFGKMKTLTYPDNEKVTYSYDEAGQLSAINGKELDTETGLAYYGARYYSPELSVWYGVDPLMEKYSAYSPYV